MSCGEYGMIFRVEINSTQQASVLIPVSVSFAGQTVDMTLPSQVALVELLPGMVRALGRLTTESATQGYRVMNASGSLLSQSSSLSQQGVYPGTLLTLEVIGTSLGDTRYDDIVEAVGKAVNTSQKPWQRGDSVQLSAYCAVALFVVAALMLVTQSHGTVPAVIALAGAALVTLAAAVVARVPHAHSDEQSPSWPGGALALAMVVPLLTACAAFVAVDGPWFALPLAGAGAAAMLGSAAVMVLPAGTRRAIFGPLFAGGAMLLAGGLNEWGHVPAERAAALVIAMLAIVVVSTPWIGMARTPIRIGEPSSRTIDGEKIHASVQRAAVLARAVEVGSVLAVIGFTPVVAGTSVAGCALAVCVGLSLMLSTRSLYGKAEVLIGVLAGMTTTLLAGLTAAATGMVSPFWAVGIMVGVGIFVVATNVVGQRMRPWLTRFADATNILALAAILPLTALVWGII